MGQWILVKVLKGIGMNLLILYLATLKGRMDTLRELAEKNAEKQKEYAKIASEYRDTADAVERLRHGTF